MGAFERKGGLARFILYFILLLWAFLLLCLCCARLSYTTHWRDEPSLMGGRPFYDPSVVELLVCSFLGIGFSLCILRHLWCRNPNDPLAKNWFEVGGLALLWLLWVGGAGSATTVWPDLSWCIQYSPCVLLQALMGFAWLGWLTITVLLFVSLYFVFSRGLPWEQNHFDNWGFGLGIKNERAGSIGGGEGATRMSRIESRDNPPVVPPKSTQARGKSRGDQNYGFGKAVSAETIGTAV